MAQNKRNRSSRQRPDSRCNKMHARSESLRSGVRVAVCFLGLMGCVAFAVASLPHYRKLEVMEADLEEVRSAEVEVANRVDAKERELRAIESDPQYREIIARDRLNYYEPGEHVFRIAR